MERESSDRRRLVSPTRETLGRMDMLSRARSRSRSRSRHDRQSRRSSSGRLWDRERELDKLRECLRVLEGAIREERGRLDHSRSKS